MELDCEVDMEFQCVYVLLSWLCKEFEPWRAQLLARGLVPILYVLSKRRAKETHLCGPGFLEISSVLAPRVPTMLFAPPVSYFPSASLLLPTSSRGVGRSCPRYQCDYFNKDGHNESHCHKKECDKRNREHSSSSWTRTSTLTPSTVALTSRIMWGSIRFFLFLLQWVLQAMLANASSTAW
jgi:hypothetical protein